MGAFSTKINFKRGGEALSSIAHALQKLDTMVGELEGSVSVVEQTIAGCQRDMFAGEPSNENGGGVTRAAVTEKLDNAIEQVQGLLLGEG